MKQNKWFVLSVWSIILCVSAFLLSSYTHAQSQPTFHPSSIKQPSNIFPIEKQTVHSGINSVSESNSAPTSTYFSYQGQLLDNNNNPITGSRSMTFKLYDTLDLDTGTLCWSETQSVSVQGGVFNVLLGSVNEIDMTDPCFANDVYLELTIDSTRLDPRQLLTSNVHAVNATQATGNFTVLDGILIIENGSDGSGIPSISWQRNDTNTYWRTTMWADEILRFRFNDGVNWRESLQLDKSGDIVIPNGQMTVTHPTENPFITFNHQAANSQWRLVVGSGGNINFQHYNGTSWDQILRLNTDGSCQLSSLQQEAVAFQQETEEPCGTLQIDRLETNSLQTGAIIEANLPLPVEYEQLFSEGDLLCLHEEQLALCDASSSPLVQAVANTEGKPVVLGAELVKVIGPVEEGDYLVTSPIPGYAMATKKPTFGIVIGQALESFEGKSGLILAMIRKM